jgi:hypothetical protein
MDLVKSFSPWRILIPSAAAVQLLGSNPRRRGLIVSGSAEDFSLSFAPNPVINQAAFNFFANQPWTLVLEYSCLGDAITLPLYGISKTAPQTVEFLEIVE